LLNDWIKIQFDLLQI